MTFEEYKEYLLTQAALYNKKVVEKLIKNMQLKGVLKNEEGDFEEYKKNYKTVVRRTIDSSGISAVNVLEEWEFIKNYQYSVLYKTSEMNRNLIIEVLNKLNLQMFTDDKEEVETLQHIITKPIIFIDEDKIFLKFPLMKTGVKPSGDGLKVKYPIIAILDTISNILEIRYDSINGILVDDYKQFYKKNLKSIKVWIKNNLDIDIDNLDLYNAVVKIKDAGVVKLGGQDMRFSDGSKACLEVGSDVFTLPLIGELKEIILENEEEFNKALTIKQVLETWITSKEEEADYIWICLCWQDDKNRKSYEVKVRFIFDYFDEDETLLYHYSGPIGMERMENVTATIIQYL